MQGYDEEEYPAFIAGKWFSHLLMEEIMEYTDRDLTKGSNGSKHLLKTYENDLPFHTELSKERFSNSKMRELRRRLL
jgi:hypothetical protein